LAGADEDGGVEKSGTRDPVRTALADCRRHFIYAGIFSGLINILYLAPSIFMLQVYDRVVPTRGTATLLVLVLVLAFALLVLTTMDVARMRLLERASVRLEKLGAGPLLTHVLGSQSGGAKARAQATRDFDTIRATLAGPAIIALFDAPWAPIYIFVSFLLHPWLGLLALASALGLAVLAWAGERSTQASIRTASARQADVGRAQDISIQSADVVRALGMRGAAVRRHLIQRSDLVAVQGEIAHRSASFLAATKFLRLLLQSTALAVGAWLAIEQRISAGAIFAAALILGRALQPVEQILGALKSLLAARAAYQALVSFCENGDFNLARTQLPPPTGQLTVEGATVLVPGTDRRILDNISFRSEPGELIALVGPSGAGKTTLLRMLAGAIEPDIGEVRLDGARHGDWDQDRLGRHIGYMPQDPTLFPGTIRENISRMDIGGEDPGDIDEAIVAAANMAGAHGIILRMGMGYETDLMDRNGGLSAGQCQLVALARALYRQPKLILLDEPNAHLDGDGEARLLETFAELKRRGSMLVVSTHRTSILQVADKILVLRDGAMHAYGNRDDIMRGASTEPLSAPELIASKAAAA
jgi:PrtD family type I secretion system ABC transporter